MSITSEYKCVDYILAFLHSLFLKMVAHFPCLIGADREKMKLCVRDNFYLSMLLLPPTGQMQYSTIHLCARDVDVLLLKLGFP